MTEHSTGTSPEDIRQALLICLKETFESGYGYFLDRGTSLFETLAAVPATEASRAAAPTVGTIAAQINHITFYLDEAIRFVRQGEPDEHPDWPGSWKVTTVTGEEWEALQHNLRTSYASVQDLVRGNPDWSGPMLTGAIAMVAHCAYHLGEIRQALSVIRPVA